MPRKPRENLGDGKYHVFARGNDRRSIYVDDFDRAAYLHRLESVIEAMRWRCLAYCLMPNHVHLLVETPEANLSTGMQRLHGPYTQRFNARHGSVGHLFQGRYGAKRIDSDAQLQVTAAYIARNPVEAGLCDSPEDWKWGSYGALIDSSAPEWLDHARLLGYFGPVASSALRQLRSMVRAEPPTRTVPDPETNSA